MKIGVDAGMLGITDERLQVGVWRVAKELLTQLGRMDKVNTYVLYSFRPIPKDVMQSFGHAMTNRVLSPSLGWMQVRLPIELLLRPVDVFLGLSQALPMTATKTIGVVYDLGFLKHPALYPNSAAKLVSQTQYLTRTADAIMTISEAIKKEIGDTYAYPASRIHVAYPRIGDAFTSTGKPYIHPNPYFLCVGSFKRGKNIPTLIRAFGTFTRHTKTPTDLILVGSSYWQDPAIVDAIQSEKIGDHVIIKGYVKDKDLAPLYRGAIAFVCPSLVEGFGIPFTEAMASGIPVIGSSIPVLKEVVGDAGVLVDPHDTHALADAMEKITNGKILRETLIKHGRVRAKKYSWDAMAKIVYDLL
ncbi:MAG: glycosyltransferase family 1 protein [Patescibacteria group bacterium]